MHLYGKRNIRRRCTYANRLSSTYLSRFLLDVLGLLLGVGRLRTEAEPLGGDTVAGADAAVRVRKGVVAEADCGGHRSAAGGGGGGGARGRSEGGAGSDWDELIRENLLPVAPSGNNIVTLSDGSATAANEAAI